MLLLHRLYIAYCDARRHKRTSDSQLKFEISTEENLIKLRDEIRDRVYALSPGICFITNYPVKREIYASPFRDRVVQHLLFNYLSPIFEKQFIYDSYSCRVGKGTHFGIKRFDHHLRSVTDNYRKEAYIMQLDIQGYFMSINRAHLYQIIQMRLAKAKERELCGADWELVDFLLQRILFRNPVEGVRIIGKRSNWDGLPASKSLLKSPAGVGLPIGDLTSQLFSNIYLGELDYFVKRNLKVEHYGRYVDDFFLMHTSKEYLWECKEKIESFLREKLSLTLHPQKIRLSPAKFGGLFLGGYVLPHRVYARNRTIYKFYSVVNHIEKELATYYNKSARNRRIIVAEEKDKRLFCALYPERVEELNKMLGYMQTLNSYCGILSHYKCYNILKRKLEGATVLRRYFCLNKGYSGVRLRHLPFC